MDKIKELLSRINLSVFKEIISNIDFRAIFSLKNIMTIVLIVGVGGGGGWWYFHHQKVLYQKAQKECLILGKVNKAARQYKFFNGEWPKSFGEMVKKKRSPISQFGGEYTFTAEDDYILHVMVETPGINVNKLDELTDKLDGYVQRTDEVLEILIKDE